MTPGAYYGAWLVAGLIGIAIVSGWITHWLSRCECRRARAEEMLEALAGYSEWLGSQRRQGQFNGDRPRDVSPLEHARSIQATYFPLLAPQMVEIMVTHSCMIDFLWRQQMLRSHDPEAWLESDHDRHFLRLWEAHARAVHGLARRVRASTGGVRSDPEPESVFPA